MQGHLSGTGHDRRLRIEQCPQLPRRVSRRQSKGIRNDCSEMGPASHHCVSRVINTTPKDILKQTELYGGVLSVTSDRYPSAGGPPPQYF